MKATDYKEAKGDLYKYSLFFSGLSSVIPSERRKEDCYFLKISFEYKHVFSVFSRTIKVAIARTDLTILNANWKASQVVILLLICINCI